MKFSLMLPVLIAIGATSLVAAPTTAPTPLSRDQIAAIVQPYIDEKYVPAVVVGVFDTSGARVGAFGVDDAGKPVTPQSVFEIGSVTKTFTGLLLADAVVRGEVKLDDPVQSLLPPEVKLAQVGPRPIELIDLATHRSGLPRMPSNLNPADLTKPYDDYTTAQLNDFLTHLTPSRAPGVKAEYSNLGAGLLGHVLAQRAGKSYVDLLKERIFTPIGIDADPISANVIGGHDPSGQPTSNWLLPEPVAGAGCVRLSGEQLLKFAAAQIKPPEILANAIQLSHTARAAFEGTDNSISLFWMIRPDGVYWHNGETGGFSSYVGFDPKARVAVVVLENIAASCAVQIGVTLLHRETHRPDPPALKLRHAVELQPAQLDRFVGDYRIGLMNMLSVRRHGSQLTALITGQSQATIFTASATQCFWKIVDAGAEFEFLPNGEKRVTIRQSGQVTHGATTTQPSTTHAATTKE